MVVQQFSQVHQQWIFQIQYSMILEIKLHHHLINTVNSNTTEPSSRQYPDSVNYINSGIISTSPYSFYKSKEGPTLVIPLQSRLTIAGLNSDKLLDNVFSGDPEFLVIYSMTTQYQSESTLTRGWHINQRPSAKLPPNEVN
ncbi:hypothetical protein ACTFIU_002314 [Dictyostelium citrinum]